MMGQHAHASRFDDQPRFEPPPVFGDRFDRRMSVRAIAAWLQPDGRADVVELAANELWIDVTATGAIVVDRVGGAIAAAFGVPPGPVTARRDTLAARIAEAAMAGSSTEPTIFDGAMRGVGGPASIMLARGVILPLGNGRARVVVSWKEAATSLQNQAIHTEISLSHANFSRKTAANDPFSAPAATVDG